jgi:hypothetical protein
LRTNLTDDDPAQLWGYYLQLVTVEQAFKSLKDESRRPADLPSAGEAHRGTHFDLLPGLLPSGYVATAAASLRR